MWGLYTYEGELAELWLFFETIEPVLIWPRGWLLYVIDEFIFIFDVDLEFD